MAATTERIVTVDVDVPQETMRVSPDAINSGSDNEGEASEVEAEVVGNSFKALHCQIGFVVLEKISVHCCT